MPIDDMDRTISSEARPLCVFFGIVWVLIFGGVLVLGFVFENAFFTYLGLGAAILGLALFFWLFIKSSLVAKITSEGLYLRLFKGNCIVPFTNIKSVSGGWIGPFCFPHESLVNVEFHKQTVLGTRIKFVPAIDLDSYSNTYKPFRFKRQQNIVVYELQKLIDQNKVVA
ncbi:MAG: hypothetical protein P8X90_13255 [Desulfobacterales bacterium]